jgi:hypothetical protein
MSQAYFGGSSAFNSTVRKLEATSFRTLVESYIHIPVTKRFTREEYHAASQDEQKKLKDCAFICACTFKEGATRCDANAEKVVLVVVDLDEGGGEFAESPDAIAEALHPFNFAAYTTCSHTPERPRLKIVVDVTPCEKNLHRRFVAKVVEMLGLPPKFKGATESSVIVQPQYRPVQFSGEEFTAVLSSRIDGVPMTVKDLPDEPLPSDDDRTYAFDGEFDSDLTSLPLPDVTVESIREPLFKIDPDVNYREWVCIIAALRHQFRDEEQAHEAYALLDEWSATGSKYKEGETYFKWRSVRPDAVGRSPVTLRSLYKLAMDAGWDNSPAIAASKDSIIGWLNSCQSEDEIINQGCQKIVALPFPDPITEEILVHALRARIKEITKFNVSVATIEEKLRDLRRQKRAESDSGEIPNWLKPWCYISTINKFRNIVNGTELMPEAFNNAYSRYLLSKDGESEDARAARPVVLPVHFALNDRQIKVCDSVIYDPRNGGEEPFFSHKGRTYLNTYLPSSVPEEDPKRSDEAGELFMTHLRALIAEEEYVQTILHFLCHVVQKPGTKIRWVPLIQSAEGAGKGTLKKMMQAVLGHPNVKEVPSDVLADKWTDWMTGAVFTVLNEIHIPGQHRERVFNSLKTYVTDDDIAIVAKHVNTATDVPNLTNSIAFTNAYDALFMKSDNRRWMPIESPLQSKEDVTDLNESGHFERVKPLFGELGGALRHWMLRVAIPKTFAADGNAPVTKYRNSVIEESKNPLHVLVERLIRGDDPLVGPEVVHGERLRDLTASMQNNGKKATHYLREMGYTAYQEGKRFDIDGVVTDIWVHRRRYDAKLMPAEEMLRGIGGDL